MGEIERQGDHLEASRIFACLMWLCISKYVWAQAMFAQDVVLSYL